MPVAVPVTVVGVSVPCDGLVPVVAVAIAAGMAVSIRVAIAIAVGAQVIQSAPGRMAVAVHKAVAIFTGCR